MDLFLAPRRYLCGQSVGDENSFSWVVGVIAALRSPITHLTIEIRVYDPAGLHIMDWKAVDVLLSSRVRSLVQVSVIFLEQLQGVCWESIVYPVTIRRLMPLTSMMGLLTFSTRGPTMSTAQPPSRAAQYPARSRRRRRVAADAGEGTSDGKTNT